MPCPEKTKRFKRKGPQIRRRKKGGGRRKKAKK
jgi:hypothetical protein